MHTVDESAITRDFTPFYDLKFEEVVTSPHPHRIGKTQLTLETSPIFRVSLPISRKYYLLEVCTRVHTETTKESIVWPEGLHLTLNELLELIIIKNNSSADAGCIIPRLLKYRPFHGTPLRGGDPESFLRRHPEHLRGEQLVAAFSSCQPNWTSTLQSHVVTTESNRLGCGRSLAVPPPPLSA